MLSTTSAPVISFYPVLHTWNVPKHATPSAMSVASSSSSTSTLVATKRKRSDNKRRRQHPASTPSSASTSKQPSCASTPPLSSTAYDQDTSDEDEIDFSFSRPKHLAPSPIKNGIKRTGMGPYHANGDEIILRGSSCGTMLDGRTDAKTSEDVVRPLIAKYKTCASSSLSPFSPSFYS